MTKLQILQANLQHAAGATAVLINTISQLSVNIALVQEPWVGSDGKLKGIGNFRGNVFSCPCELRPRTCILATTGIDAMILPQFTTRDLVAIKIKGCRGEVILASGYFPYPEDAPPPEEVKSLVEFCRNKGSALLLGCDANAHNQLWGSSDTNSRGESLFEFLLESNLIVLNRGSQPTFRNSLRSEVIDLTIATKNLVHRVSKWRVSEEESLSDHMHIRFELDEMQTKSEVSFRNPKKTDWNLYDALLCRNLAAIPVTVNNANEVEILADRLSNSIINAYHCSCPLKINKFKRRSPWWTGSVETARRKAKRLKNKLKRSETPELLSEYAEARREFKREIRSAKRNCWRNYCHEMESQSDLSRLHKVLSHNRQISEGPIIDENGVLTDSHEEALAALIRKHFPECQITTNAGGRGEDEQQFDALEIPPEAVTSMKVRKAVESFAPFKTSGPDGIMPALLQHNIEQLNPYLVVVFKGSLRFGYIPKKWRNVRIAFIPKPGKTDYTLASSFRPISLCSFLLKTLERLVDWHIRQHVSFHKAQHAYQSGKSTESALHCLTNIGERSLRNKELALCTFADIDGAFNNVNSAAIRHGMERKAVDSCLIRWTMAMLHSREVFSSRVDVSVRARVQRGCPQGGVLSPLLWILVVDELLEMLTEKGITVIAYADDIFMAILGTVPSVVVDLMRDALEEVMKWCVNKGLGINPSKTQALLFTNRRNVNIPPLTVKGTTIELSPHVKYLGVWIDSKLNWKTHVEKAIARARASFWVMRGCFSNSWGLSPKSIAWLYQAIVRPILTYGCAVWWKRSLTEHSRQQLNKLQRLIGVAATGVIRTTPTAALEVIMNWPPLHIFIESQAIASLHRLARMELIEPGARLTGHLSSYKTFKEKSHVMAMPQDFGPKTLLFSSGVQFKVPTREQWAEESVLAEVGPDITWYTDGSLMNGCAGAGLHCEALQLAISLPLGRHVTVFQAETYAIKVSADVCLEEGVIEKKIAICTDSQAAIAALSGHYTTSSLVRESKHSLNNLANKNEVYLIWVPGHSNIAGNELADELARNGSGQQIQGPEPFLPVALCTIKRELTNEVSTRCAQYWRSQSGATHAKACLAGHSQKFTKQLLSLSRTDVRMVCAMLTGHGPFRKHLARIGVQTENVCCRFCEEEDETGWHLLMACPAIWRERLAHLGFALGSESKMDQVKISPQAIKKFYAKVGLSY